MVKNIENGLSIMFYEILLEYYLLPPNEKSEELSIPISKSEIESNNVVIEEDLDDIHTIIL